MFMEELVKNQKWKRKFYDHISMIEKTNKIEMEMKMDEKNVIASLEMNINSMSEEFSEKMDEIDDLLRDVSVDIRSRIVVFDRLLKEIKEKQMYVDSFEKWIQCAIDDKIERDKIKESQ